MDKSMPTSATSPRQPWISFILLCALSAIGMGCSKKVEQCAAFVAQTGTLNEKLGIDVATEKDAKKKASDLGALLASVRKAHEETDKLGVNDAELTSKATVYTKALSEVETSATDLKQFLEKVDATNAPIAALAVAKLAVDEATQAHLNELSLAEKKKIAAALAPFGDTPGDLEKTAAVIETTKYGGDEATKKSVTLAVALRQKAAARRTTDGLQATLDELQRQSGSKRSAFALARTRLKNAIAALNESCATAK